MEKSRSLSPASPLAGYVVALLAVAAALALTLRFEPLAERASFILFYAAVVASAWYGGPRPGVLAVGLSMLAAAVYVLPQTAPPASDSANLSRLVLFAAVSLAVVSLSHARVRAQLRLLNKEWEMADFVENAPIGLHRIGPDGRILWANRAELELLGYTREEFIGHNIAEFHVDREMVEEALERLRSGETLRDIPARLRCKDGSIKHVQVSSNVQIEGGRFISARCFTRDITERTKAEEALRASEVRLRMALEAAYMGTWDYNVLTGEVKWSPNLEAIHGLEPGTFGGTFEAYMSDIHPEDLSRVTQTLAHTLQHGEDHHIEYRIVWPDGSVHWIEGKGRIIRDPAGQPTRMTGVCLDITERKLAEEREHRLLRAAEEGRRRLAFMAEASARLAASIDFETRLESLARLLVPALADYCIIDVIRQDRQIHRVAMAHSDPEKEKILGGLRSFPPDPDRSAGVTEVLNSGKPELATSLSDPDLDNIYGDKEHRELIRKLGMRSYMIVPLLARGRTIGAISLVMAESGRSYSPADLTLAEELAHRAALAVDNARLYRDAQQANRAKDEFLATISHELRTPLNAIIGWICLLRRDRLDQASRDRALETIERNAKLQVQLVEDLLDVSSIITGKLRLDVRNIELVPVVEAAIDSVRPAAEAKGISLLTELDRDAGPVAGDPDRLQQVVWNLLANAIKFTPAGGTIRVRLERAASHVEVRVSDTGGGIKPDFLPYAFDRFRQGDVTLTRRHGGLGLGLAIVRHLVEMHGGTVAADSGGEGLGATFTVRLPVAARARLDSTESGERLQKGSIV